MYIHRALQYSQNVLTEFSYLLINFWQRYESMELPLENFYYYLYDCSDAGSPGMGR